MHQLPWEAVPVAGAAQSWQCHSADNTRLEHWPEIHSIILIQCIYVYNYGGIMRFFFISYSHSDKEHTNSQRNIDQKYTALSIVWNAAKCYIYIARFLWCMHHLSSSCFIFIILWLQLFEKYSRVNNCGWWLHVHVNSQQVRANLGLCLV